MTITPTHKAIAMVSENPSLGELAIIAGAYRRVHAIDRHGTPRDAVRQIPDEILLWLYDRGSQHELPVDATDGQRCDLIAAKLADLVIDLDSLEGAAG